MRGQQGSKQAQVWSYRGAMLPGRTCSVNTGLCGGAGAATQGRWHHGRAEAAAAAGWRQGGGSRPNCLLSWLRQRIRVMPRALKVHLYTQLLQQPAAHSARAHEADCYRNRLHPRFQGPCHSLGPCRRLFVCHRETGRRRQVSGCEAAKGARGPHSTLSRNLGQHRDVEMQRSAAKPSHPLR